MSTTVKTFDIKNGLSVANTIVISNTSGTINISNINTANINTLNLATQLAQFANVGVYVNGTLVANNPNINFVAANTSNLSISGTSNTSPGNVTVTFDTVLPVGGGSSTIITNDTFTVAVANQTVFTLTANASGAAYVIVTRNGLTQLPLADYTVTSNNILTLFANTNINDVIDTFIFSSVSIGVVGAYQADIYANGSIVLANADLNFNNTATINVSGTSNGATQANLAFSVNSSAITNVISLNVSSNISNVGNLLVTQNTFTGNLSVTQNITTGNILITSNGSNITNATIISTVNTSLNISGNINVSSNISNTGNLLVTQNTFTGNLSVTTLINTTTLNVSTNANVAALNVGGLTNTITLNVSSNANVAALNVAGLANVGSLNVAGISNVATLNVLGILTVNASPLINLSTRAMTGITCNTTANAQTNSNTAQSNILSCTFNEVGAYQIEGLINYGLNITTANAGFAGMNIAFGNSGTATIATLKYAATGKANSNTIISNLITTTAQTTIIPNTTSIANSTNNTDYLILTGFIRISGTGTVNIQIASANSLNANLNVCTNSYVVFTKIG